MRRGGTSLPDLMASVTKAISANSDYDQRNNFSGFFYQIDARPFLESDPFDATFKNMMLDLCKAISGKNF